MLVGGRNRDVWVAQAEEAADWVLLGEVDLVLWVEAHRLRGLASRQTIVHRIQNAGDVHRVRNDGVDVAGNERVRDVRSTG